MTHWATTRPRARKRHRCEMCARIIEPGETYLRGAGMDGATAWTWIECAHCDAFRTYAHTLGMDPEYGPDLLIEFEPASIAEARVRAQYRRRWRRLDGDLYPVPEVIWHTDSHGFGRPSGIAPGTPQEAAA